MRTTALNSQAMILTMFPMFPVLDTVLDCDVCTGWGPSVEGYIFFAGSKVFFLLQQIEARYSGALAGSLKRALSEAAAFLCHGIPKPSTLAFLKVSPVRWEGRSLEEPLRGTKCRCQMNG